MERLALYGGEPVRKDKLPSKKPYFDEQEVEAVRRSLQQESIGGDGPCTRELEEQLCRYLGVQHAYFTNSCTTAIHMAMLALDLRNAEFIVPDYAFASIATVGLFGENTPIIVDVEERTANLDPIEAGKHLSPKTKVIIPVHYAGHPADMEKINALADQKGLFVIEDAAQALGSAYKGKKAGTMSDVGCFSFHESKNLTCGEGGLFVTDNEQLAEKALMIRDKGTSKYWFLRGKISSYDTKVLGNSYVQSDILAAVLLAQMKKIDRITTLRTAHAAALTKGLQQCSLVTLPTVEPYATPNWHLFPIRVPVQHQQFFIKALNAEGIAASIHFVPLHQHELFKDKKYHRGNLRNSIKIYESLVKLPLYPSLRKQDINDIITAVKKVQTHINV